MNLKSAILLPLLRFSQDRLIAIAIRFSARLSFHKGLTLARLPSEEQDEAIQDIKAAIDLIESIDPRRFLRVARFVDFVYSTDPRNTWMVYLPHSRIALVNVARVRRERPEERDRIGTIAALIVGCSLDGMLFNKRIFPSKGNGTKIERIRYAEMRRFLQRVVNEALDPATQAAASGIVA